MSDEFDPYYRWLAIPPDHQSTDRDRLECDVAIYGVRELRLVVECAGANIGADALWIDARAVP